VGQACALDKMHVLACFADLRKAYDMVPHGARGVRQGRPRSPLLFDLYIDSILDDCEEVGISRGGQLCVPGLLLADDLVCLANTTQALEFLLSKVSSWAGRWGMQIGAKKCGAMAFRARIDGGMEEAQRRVNVVEWKLQGEVIPVVQKYTNLGLDFTICR
jgi:hypothetical protein